MPSRFNNPNEIRPEPKALAFVNRAPSGECWEWDGRLSGEGYSVAHAWVNGVRRTGSAHRLIYVLTRGAVDPDLHIDHLCHNRACVNPAHMEPVTVSENCYRRRPKAPRSHCLRGHELTDDNLIPSNLRSGKRSCLTCHRDRSAARRAA